MRAHFSFKKQRTNLVGLTRSFSYKYMPVWLSLVQQLLDVIYFTRLDSKKPPENHKFIEMIITAGFNKQLLELSLLSDTLKKIAFWLIRSFLVEMNKIECHVPTLSSKQERKSDGLMNEVDTFLQSLHAGETC